MVLDLGGLTSRRRPSRARRWRIPMAAAGVLAAAGAGLFALGGTGDGLASLIGPAGRGAGAPDALPDAGSEGPGAEHSANGSRGPGASPSTPGGAVPPGSTDPSRSQSPYSAHADADGQGSATPGRPGGGSSSPAAPPDPSTPSPPPPTPDGALRPGDRGAEVRTLQQRLYGQGFTYVTVNGVYDDDTRRGVAQLQSDRGLSGDPSGIYGPHTRAAFGLG
ncbi:peptidoglycan-binding protein [Streptomyces sp. NPDC051183]|uniref:peptidoglycan-binding domain-containing protein n=1 Tax=Streptomyces sp. NPDC051183 TaxID=3155165 RepID=UPI0034433B2F